MKKTLILFCNTISVILLCASCEKASDVPYPYEEHELIYMGMKAGLTSSSSDAAFDAGLNEVLQDYVDRNPGSTVTTFDGIKYESTNLQTVTGGIPEAIWTKFWDSLDKYSYSVGSCWIFGNIHIPAKGKTGTAHFIYAIVTDDYNEEVRYIAVRADFSPLKNSRAILSSDVAGFALNNCEPSSMFR